ncbi:SDR family NAD(P)-dependent oxidoreductase [Gordonia insulae]|uniref:1-deoxy-11-beta-hydroxypentalenate dehydrogenase n=1 Tax=Gordonia insulae TaxID=2420509 RepID=A0A3G8JLN4_9ACTN|nr:SDR family NAD(P)-dependent oxidoreductase [Gordonia insulae]AZG45505.1 1-deoxy-11-beta-hydroxypentalenate dehydrogenase [Gordonia insulae]
MRVAPGQVAVVTGGASGIGYGLAAGLGSRGVKIVLADIREPGLAQAKTSLTDRGIDVLTVVTDVGDPDSVQQLADATIRHFGRVDIVCNNAGVVGAQAPMWEQQRQTWQWLINIKLMGVVHGVTAFAPLLLEQGTGHILNTASAGGLMPLPTMTPYNATMHAVVGLTETLNIELRGAAAGVGASVLCPGRVATGLGTNSEALQPAAGVAAIGNPQDSAESVLDPAELAELTIAAIEAGTVHIVAGAGAAVGARTRLDSVLRDLTQRP